MASMWALEAITSAVSSSRPARDALPDSSRRASTRWPSCLASSLRARDRLGRQPHLQRGGLPGQLVRPQPRGRRGEDLIGVGGVGVGHGAGTRRDRRWPGPGRSCRRHPGQDARHRAVSSTAASIRPRYKRRCRPAPSPVPRRGTPRPGSRPGPRGPSPPRTRPGGGGRTPRSPPSAGSRPGSPAGAGLQSPDQLVIRQGAALATAAVTAASTGPARSTSAALSWPNAALARLPAEPVRTAHRRQQLRVHVTRVAEAERTPGPQAGWPRLTRPASSSRTSHAKCPQARVMHLAWTVACQDSRRPPRSRG